MDHSVEVAKSSALTRQTWSPAADLVRTSNAVPSGFKAHSNGEHNMLAQVAQLHSAVPTAVRQLAEHGLRITRVVIDEGFPNRGPHSASLTIEFADKSSILARYDGWVGFFTVSLCPPKGVNESHCAASLDNLCSTGALATLERAAQETKTGAKFLAVRCYDSKDPQQWVWSRRGLLPGYRIDMNYPSGSHPTQFLKSASTSNSR